MRLLLRLLRLHRRNFSLRLRLWLLLLSLLLSLCLLWIILSGICLKLLLWRTQRRNLLPLLYQRVS